MGIDQKVDVVWAGSMKHHNHGVVNDDLTPDYKGHSFNETLNEAFEGHSGWRIDQILSNTKPKGDVVWHDPHGWTGDGNIKEWLPDYRCTPTCTLLHLGTNDVIHNDNTDET